MTRPGSKHQHQQPHQHQQLQQPQSMALSRSLYRSLICHVNFERAAREALGGRDRGRETERGRRAGRRTQEVTQSRIETEEEEADRVEQRDREDEERKEWIRTDGHRGREGGGKGKGGRWKIEEEQGTADTKRPRQSVGQTNKLAEDPI